jgi:hypothetical protein
MKQGVKVNAISAGVSYLLNKILNVVEFMDCVTQLLGARPVAGT